MEDLGLICFKLLSDSPSSWDFSLSKGLELSLCCRVFLLRLSFYFFFISSDTLDTDEVCFMPSILFLFQTYYSAPIITMRPAIMASLLFCILTMNSTVGEAAQPDQNDNKGPIDQKGCGMERLEAVGYLKNVRNLDLLLNYLHCNHTVSFKALGQGMNHIIHESRDGVRPPDQNFSCTGKGLLDSPGRYQCWLCQKEFKNNSYLATHYLVRHSSQFRHQTCSPQKWKDEASLSTLQVILGQSILQFISPGQLQVLFTSLVPQQEVYQFCIQLFARVSQQASQPPGPQPIPNRYGSFLTKQDYHELCLIIALRMHETSMWTNVGRYVGMTFLLAAGVALLAYLINSRAQEQANQRFKFKKY